MNSQQLQRKLKKKTFLTRNLYTVSHLHSIRMDVPHEKKSAPVLLSSPEGLQWRKVLHGQARLESTRRSSIILGAFTFSIYSSLQLNFPSECPSWIMTLLAMNSALLISMHSFSFIISTCILPKLEAVSEEFVPPKHGDEHIKAVPTFSPHDRFRGFVKISYNISHVLGLFLFLIEIALIAWVKFWDVSIIACIASSAVVLPFMIAFALFCWHFHRMLNTHLYNTRAHVIQDVEREYRSEENYITCSTPNSPSSISRNYSQNSLVFQYPSVSNADTKSNFSLSPNDNMFKSTLQENIRRNHSEHSFEINYNAKCK